MISLIELANRLDKPKRIGQNKLIARCPAHDDKSPSLSITYVDNKVLMHCFGGCEVASVLDALGLTFDDLMPEKINV